MQYCLGWKCIRCIFIEGKSKKCSICHRNDHFKEGDKIGPKQQCINCGDEQSDHTFPLCKECAGW